MPWGGIKIPIVAVSTLSDYVGCRTTQKRKRFTLFSTVCHFMSAVARAAVNCVTVRVSLRVSLAFLVLLEQLGAP